MIGQQRFDFARLGKPAVGFLRIHQLAVDDDLEDAVFAFDQFGSYAEPRFNVVRQTGGAGAVVSNDAVFDGYHERPPGPDHSSEPWRHRVGSRPMRKEALR
jgi:hypothetical protein